MRGKGNVEKTIAAAVLIKRLSSIALRAFRRKGVASCVGSSKSIYWPFLWHSSTTISCVRRGKGLFFKDGSLFN